METIKNIRICLGSSCFSRGNEENLQILKQFVATPQSTIEIDFKGHLCNENCNRGPVIEINSTIHEEVFPENIHTVLANYNLPE